MHRSPMNQWWGAKAEKQILKSNKPKPRLMLLIKKIKCESELQRLRFLKKSSTIFERVKKGLYDIQKQQQQKEKSQNEVDKLRRSIASKEKERNTLEERLNGTKQRSRGRERNTLSESHASFI